MKKIIIIVIIISNMILIINSIFSFHIFSIQSGSMEQELKIGDIILTKKEKEYQIGDVITYLKDNCFITHRIVQKQNDVYETKGDNNNVKDKEIVKENQILGKVICHSTILGKIIGRKYFCILFIIFLGIFINIFQKMIKKGN